eukprot:525470_1
MSRKRCRKQLRLPQLQHIRFVKASEWVCAICTLVNDESSNECAVCDTERPPTATSQDSKFESNQHSDTPNQKSRKINRNSRPSKMSLLSNHPGEQSVLFETPQRDSTGLYHSRIVRFSDSPFGLPSSKS